ncbi:VG15 protein [Rhodococcoides fascians]|uniref:VG15 protein n=1 Tax=Rhodococcoides fascians TaxID=1828 RepID=UPI00068C5C66|nr:ADP-ribosyltransferase [Rhodococcus fascians]
MPPPNEKKDILDDLNTLATQEVSEVWRDASKLDLSSAEFRSVIVQAVPEVIDPYAATAGDLAAGWYDEAAPELDYVAKPAALPSIEKLTASTSWALQATGEAALVSIAGFTSRAIFGQSRATVIENAEAEPGATWARHAQAGACAFCRMLSTRNEVYASRASATRVVGRKGGARGNQRLGKRFHDHCRCTATEVRPGMVYTPPSYAQAWEKQYTEAVQATSTGGAIDLRAVMAKMDEIESGGKVARSSTVAAKRAVDMRAWLAAESQYNDAVSEWLAAEQKYRTTAPPRVLTESQGRDLGRRTWRDYADGVAVADREAVRAYTGNGYEDINEYLRGLTSTVSDSNASAITRLDRVMDAAPRVPENLRASRAVGADVFSLTEASDPRMLVGRKFRDGGFMSTAMQSDIRSVNRGEVELRLDVPAGTRGLYVSSHDRDDDRSLAVFGPSENELLLGRGVEYEITGAVVDGGRTILTGRVIGQRGSGG